MSKKAINIRFFKQFLIIYLLFFISSFAFSQTCTITPTPLSFGSISPLTTTATNATATLTLSCTGVLATGKLRICFNFGTGTGGTTYAPRTAANGSNLLNYNIYADSAYTVILGRRGAAYPAQGADFTPTLTGTVNAILTVFGSVPGSQTGLVAGTYTSSFAGAQAEYDYQTWTINAPSCTTLTANATALPLTVNATVINDCTVSASSINFNSSGVLSTALTANGTLTVACTLNAPYAIALNGGTNGTISSRKMKISSGTSTVDYQLYTTAARATIWGDGTTGSTVAGTGSGVAQTLTVYGTVPVQTTPTAGAYTDTVTATISY